MISRATICLYRLRHTAVAAVAPAMISRATIYLCRLRHTAVAAAAPAMISRGTIYLCRLRHAAVAAAAPAMISRVLRRSTVVVIVIVRNRSCDTTAAGTVQHCRRRSKQAASAMISRAPRRSIVVVIVIVRNRPYDVTAAATVQHCRRSSSQPHAPSLALSGTRGTTAATVQRRRSSQPHAPSLALSGTRGTTATTVQRRRSSHAPAPSLALAGLSNNIAQGQAQRDVGVDDRAEQQRPTTEIDCHGGPVPEVSGSRRQPHRWHEGDSLYRHAASDGCNHLAGPSHRQPSLSRVRPLRSGFSRTIWRCRCSPSRRDRSSRRRRQ